jgi:hypothetical protein
LPEKAFRRRKAGRYSVKKSVLFERSEFRILGILFGFSAFGGFGPRLFVTFGAMPKVKPFPCIPGLFDMCKAQRLR